MRKLQMLFVCLLASFMCHAQSALRIVNTTQCTVHVATYAEAPMFGFPTFDLRADVQVPPGTTYSFPDYDAFVLASTTSPTWWGGATLPLATAPTFAWNAAQLQFVSCSMGGCGTNVGSGLPGYPPFNSSSCMNVSFLPLPGGAPGDVEITVW